MTLAGLYSVAGLQGLGCKCEDATAGGIGSLRNFKGEIMTQEHVMLSFLMCGYGVGGSVQYRALVLQLTGWEGCVSLCVTYIWREIHCCMRVSLTKWILLFWLSSALVDLDRQSSTFTIAHLKTLLIRECVNIKWLQRAGVKKVRWCEREKERERRHILPEARAWKIADYVNTIQNLMNLI